MTETDNPFTILFDLNRNWKLGRNGEAWHLWKRDPYTGRFMLEAEVEGSRRRLLAEIERRSIYLDRAVEEKLETLPETLAPWPVEREDEA